MRISDDSRQSTNRRRSIAIPCNIPTRAIARVANAEHDNRPVLTRCAQRNPLYGDTYRW